MTPIAGRRGAGAAGRSSDDTSALDALLRDTRSAVSPLRRTLEEIFEEASEVNEGRVADYIPELARADPAWFAVSVVTTEGECFDVGDSHRLFTLQSISKPFVYGLALQDHGREGVLERVGVEPTGEAFNSIVLDPTTHRPFNPMVNAGAIATTDLLRGKDYPERMARLTGGLGRFAGRDLYVDNAVFLSERMTGHRNRAINHLMKAFGIVGDLYEDSLELYFQQCSVLVNSHDLAVMAATLANEGTNPMTRELALEPTYVKNVLAIMLSCGMYDYAGEWCWRVGLPAKSGVSGGLLAVVPGVLGIGIYSPLIDAKGNCPRGVKACKEFSTRFGLHCFAAASERRDMRREINPGSGRG
jgi:glutaminase